MNRLPGYDKWKLDDGRGEPVVICQCAACGEDICDDEEYLDFDGDPVHDDDSCVVKHARSHYCREVGTY